MTLKEYAVYPRRITFPTLEDAMSELASQYESCKHAYVQGPDGERYTAPVDAMSSEDVAAELRTIGASEPEIAALWEILDVEGFGGRESEPNGKFVLESKLEWYRTVRGEVAQ